MKFEWYYFKNFYTLDQCREISDFLKNSPSAGKDSPAHGVTKTADVHTVNWGHAKPLLASLEESAHYINKTHFGLDIYRMTDYDLINHNVYRDADDGQYGWHKDAAIGEIYDLKLTVIANISTAPYEGGHFEMFVNEPCHIPELDPPGSALVFPSFLNHRVNPVTRGTRETVSFWIPGPNFK